MKIKTNNGNLDKYKIYLTVINAIENYLKNRKYLKIDLPVLSPALLPESYLEVFETEFKYLDKKEKLYLTPSPELFLKRLLVSGVGNCYYLGKSFRNSDPPSRLHGFEFTMLEFYKMGADYMDIADEVLVLLQSIEKATNKRILNKNKKLKNKYLSLSRWDRVSVAQAFRRYAGIDDNELFDHNVFFKKAEEKGYRVKGFTYEDVWSQVYTQEVEPNLGMNGYPTLIYDYPKEFAALAKHNKDGKTAQRFEFYINGIELGDCYSELTDWKEQEKRFNIESKLIKKINKIHHPIDKGFIEALKCGLKDCSGVAIGVERLAMVFADVDSIAKLKLINII